MNGSRQAWLVAAREVRERGRSRAFVVSLVLMLLAVATAIVLPALLDQDPGTKDVGLTGAAPAALGPALQAQGEAVNTTMVLGGVVEEKSSRTVEVLLARMPARHLLAGKVAGIGVLGLAQIAATAGVALVAAALVERIDVPAVRGGVVAWAVVWFVLGYALYATVFGTLGSLASRTEDASSVTGPVTIVLVLVFVVSFAAIGSAHTTWARLVSWFPLTAPLAMPNRIAMGAATWWDPVVAVVLTLGAIAALVILGGRVYTRAILHTGSMLTLGQGVAWPSTRSAQAPLRALARREAVLSGLEGGGVRPDAGEEVGQLDGLGAGDVQGRPQRPHGALDGERGCVGDDPGRPRRPVP